MRKLVLLVLGVLLVTTAAHASVDASVEVGSVHTRTLRLERAYNETFTWQTTLDAPSVASRVWVDLHFAGAPVGATSGPVGSFVVSAHVNGRQVNQGSFTNEGGAGGSGRFDLSDNYPGGNSCAYSDGECRGPVLVAGTRPLDVVLTATLLHTPGQSSGQYEWTLGPMVVEVDRCPCFS